MTTDGHSWQVRKLQVLRGPNIWDRSPAVEIWLERPPESGAPIASRWPAWEAELKSLLASNSSWAASGTPHATAGADVLSPGQVIARIASLLQNALGCRLPRSYVAILPEDAVEQVAVTYTDEHAGRACMEFAIELANAFACGECPSPEPHWGEIRESVAAARPPAIMASLIDAAAARGVPVLKLPVPDLWQLGWGARRVCVDSRLTGWNRALSRQILDDAGATWKLLQLAGAAMFDPDEPAPPVTWHVLVIQYQVVMAWRVGGGDTAGRDRRAVSVRELAEELSTQLGEAARMLGLEVAEFALAGPDLGQRLDGIDRGIVRVSDRADLDALGREFPAAASLIAERILDGLFPKGRSSRIPVIAVTGTNGKTTTARLCAHVLAQTGQRVGLTSTDGIYLAGRRVDTDDCSGPRSARSVLMNPAIDMAVLETARGGILREGLAFGECDVAVVTNIGAGDHLGLGGVHTVERLARVKRTIVEAVSRRGAAVLKADDPLVVAMAEHCRGEVIYFSLDAADPVLVEHRMCGGRVAFAREHHVLLAEGSLEIPLVSLHRVPLTHGGRIAFQVENALAAAAAAWALGISVEQICGGLETFSSGVGAAPARFNLLELDGATVIVDYVHNTSSLRAMLNTLEQLPQPRRLAVYTAAGDRRDVDMIEQGRMLGEAFDEIILYEDQFVRGREPGAIRSLLGQGIAMGGRCTHVAAADGWTSAVDEVRRRSRPGDLILLQADTTDAAANLVQQLLVSGGATREINLSEAIGSEGNRTR